ncbi:adenylate kinase family protein [Longispora urticae]
MRLIVLGPPGSERETISGLLAAHLGVPVITSGDVFQTGTRADAPFVVQARRHMDAGEPVPEQLLVSLIRDHLARLGAAGFVLDGLPGHTVPAAAVDALLDERGTPVDRAVELVLPDAEVLRRLSGRRLCRACGRVWHLEFAPPSRTDVCDQCGGELFQRPDDSAERVTLGLRSYRPALASAVEHYRSLNKLRSIDATLPPAEICAAATAPRLPPAGPLPSTGRPARPATGSR